VDDKEYLQSFLSHLSVERGLSKNTIAAYRRDLNTFLEFLSDGNKKIGAINADVVSQFISGERCRGISEASLARRAVAIRTFYRFLAKDQGIADIAKELIPPRVPKRLPKALTISEINDLLAISVDSPAGIRDKALLELLYATGARVSELVSLEVGDLRASENEYLTVRLLGKGGKERIVPVGSFARSAVDQYLVRVRPGLVKNSRETGLFLNLKGDRLSRQSAWTIVMGAAERAGLTRKISPHALRHSFATHLIDGGADIRIVQELLGHASVTTTQIYTLVTIDKLRESYASAHPRAR
jgi:integrase/recombinase XerD